MKPRYDEAMFSKMMVPPTSCGSICPKKKVKPLIKYGVNPSTGEPAGSNFLSTVVEAVSQTDICDIPDSCPEDIRLAVIGERRDMIVNIFKSRACNLFSNMVHSLDTKYRKRLEGRFGSIRGFEDLFAYGFNIFTPSIFIYETGDEFKDHIAIHSPDKRMSRLVNVEYYIHMPIETVFDALISVISLRYYGFMNTIDMYVADSEITTDEYNELVSIVSNQCMETLSCSEGIVTQLYKEATALSNVGYPQEYGYTYNTLRNIEDTVRQSMDIEHAKKAYSE